MRCGVRTGVGRGVRRTEALRKASWAHSSPDILLKGKCFEIIDIQGQLHRDGLLFERWPLTDTAATINIGCSVKEKKSSSVNAPGAGQGAVEQVERKEQHWQPSVTTESDFWRAADWTLSTVTSWKLHLQCAKATCCSFGHVRLTELWRTFVHTQLCSSYNQIRQPAAVNFFMNNLWIFSNRFYLLHVSWFLMHENFWHISTQREMSCETHVLQKIHSFRTRSSPHRGWSLLFCGTN